jgi:MFS family permease
MHVRAPLWLHAAPRDGAVVFAIMFTLESVARATLATVITLQALALLGDARSVSLLFSTVGLSGLAASFAIPALVHYLTRRWVYTLGVGLIVGASLLLATLTVPGQMAGMLMRVFGTACLSVTTSLYIMQFINKHDLTRSEPLRLLFSASAWTVGPALGVYLYQRFGPDAAYGLSIAAALALLAFFWAMRLSDNPAIVAATRRPPPGPARNIGRFLAQPRLRLAWLITFGRSSWWVFFFIYAPVYMVRDGAGEMAGALLVSAGNAMLFLTPLFGRLGHRFGLRPVLAGAFLGTGAATLLAGLWFDSTPAVAVLLVLGAVGCVALDTVGNIPFLRAVRVHERPQMTTVFRTYVDFSDLLPPALFGLLLTWFDLRAIFVLAGLGMLSMAFWTRYIPRGM